MLTCEVVNKQQIFCAAQIGNWWEVKAIQGKGERQDVSGTAARVTVVAVTVTDAWQTWRVHL